MAGGKRIRPYILILTYMSYSDAESDDLNIILPAAASQELLHVAMLIHDDIIDRDTIRYGVKNISGQYDDYYKLLVTEEHERGHYSDSMALLAGDLLISESYSVIHQCKTKPKLIHKVHQILTESIFKVVGGEMMDTESAFKPLTETDVILISKQKTASYSFISPLLMGATLADIKNQEMKLLNELGDTLGIAYQLTDDLLGIFGEKSKTGKSNSSDITEGKHTYLIEKFYQNSTDSQKIEFSKIFNNKSINSSQINRFRELMIDSGAKQYTMKYIDQLELESVKIINELSIDSKYKNNFLELVKFCLQRDK